MNPDAFTNQELMLTVGEGHELYVHDWGNKNAKIPILFLHGGPGGSCKDRQKGRFDPQEQRVIFFDQRGCGRSVPYGSLKHNTTQDLLADIIKLLDHFNIEKCILTGGSWGSALAFYFAIAHPERVHAMVLDGIFTGSTTEIAWLDQGRFQAFYPDAWEAYLEQTPESERHDPTAYHFQRILGTDTSAIAESGQIYETLEGAVISLDDRAFPPSSDGYDPVGIRMEAHYMAHKCFMPDRYVFDNVGKLTMPVYLVQGRYDMVCPPMTAYELHKLLPNSKLMWTIGGHRIEREGWAVKRAILNQLTS